MIHAAARPTEVNPAKLAMLYKRELELCGVKQGYTIECGDVASVLRRTPRDAECDLVLLDPPYGGAQARQALDELDRTAKLRAECRVALEHHSKDDVPSVAGRLVRSGERRYGETQITFYAPRGDDSPHDEERGL